MEKQKATQKHAGNSTEHQSWILSRDGVWWGGGGEPKSQTQGKPGSPGDRLAVLATGEADSSSKT
jgi:hypothetical protein